MTQEDWWNGSEDGSVHDLDQSDLAALDTTEVHRSATNGPWALPVDESSVDTARTVLFTATNPAGTVSATALMSGQILRVDLRPPALSMTEAELAAEITLIVTLAQMQARAGQHAVLALLMRARGQDPARATSFLERNLGLPSPETVAEEKLRAFALCYEGEGEA